MKKLQEEFAGRASQSGWTFKQLLRDKHKALYSKTDTYGNLYYEPIYVRVQKETKIGDNIIPEQESYPSDNQFGTYGICTADYERALEYYNGITYEPKEDLTVK